MARETVSPVALLLSAVCLLHAPASASPYEYIKIADTSSTFSGFDPWPAVNGSGQVSFVATQRVGPLGLYRGDGTTTTLIASLPPFAFVADFGTDQVINNAGEVAYFYDDPYGSQSVCKGSGGAITTIADSANFSSIGLWGPAINDNGTVVFPGTSRATGRLGIYSGNGGSVTTIVDTSGDFSDFGLSPAINDSGTVAFSALSKATGKWGIYTINNGVTTVGGPRDPVYVQWARR